jgi:hypothetical protein
MIFKEEKSDLQAELSPVPSRVEKEIKLWLVIRIKEISLFPKKFN